MKNLDKKIEGILDNYFINMNLMIIHDPIGIAREGIKALIKEEQLRIVPEKKETKEVSPITSLGNQGFNECIDKVKENIEKT